MIRALVSALVLIAAVHASPTPQPKGYIDPCGLLTREDVFRLWGWEVTSEERAYHHFYSRAGYAFHRRAGWSCTIESSQGVVTVNVAAPNAMFFADLPFDEPYRRGMAREVHGYPAAVLLFNGTAYIRRHNRMVSVQVEPYTHIASYDEIEGLVPIVVRRLP
jgi:hypothetical protein